MGGWVGGWVGGWTGGQKYLQEIFTRKTTMKYDDQTRSELHNKTVDPRWRPFQEEITPDVDEGRNLVLIRVMSPSKMSMDKMSPDRMSHDEMSPVT